MSVPQKLKIIKKSLNIESVEEFGELIEAVKNGMTKSA